MYHTLRDATHTFNAAGYYPDVRVHETPPCLPLRDAFVYRRNFSICDTFLLHRDIKDKEAVLLRAAQSTARYVHLSSHMKLKILWHSTPADAYLNHVGELHVFLVQGRIAYIAHMTPLEQVKVMQRVGPADRIRYEVLPFSAAFLILLSRQTKLRLEPMQLQELDDATSDFHEFIKFTFNRIINDEERLSGRMSLLRLFCRLDIGVIHRQSDRRHQFVPKRFEGGLSTCLYLSTAHEEGQVLLSTLERSLHMTISKRFVFTQDFTTWK